MIQLLILHERCSCQQVVRQVSAELEGAAAAGQESAVQQGQAQLSDILLPLKNLVDRQEVTSAPSDPTAALPHEGPADGKKDPLAALLTPSQMLAVQGLRTAAADYVAAHRAYDRRPDKPERKQHARRTKASFKQAACRLRTLYNGEDRRRKNLVRSLETSAERGAAICLVMQRAFALPPRRMAE